MTDTLSSCQAVIISDFIQFRSIITLDSIWKLGQTRPQKGPKKGVLLTTTHLKIEIQGNFEN